MAQVINTNTMSLNAQRNLGTSGANLATTIQRLSSGMRINKASDDAAGLSIASSLNADERVYAQAVRNVNDGINYLNIADGALSELSNITMRQIELAEPDFLVRDSCSRTPAYDLVERTDRGRN